MKIRNRAPIGDVFAEITAGQILPRILKPDHDRAMSLALLKFAGQASLVDEAMLPS